MRKLYILALVATMFAACATDGVNEPSATIEDPAPETLTVSFEGEDSRIQLQEGKTVWSEGDLVSVFYRSNGNQKWQFQGETGERNGTLKRVDNAEATQELSDIVVVYPYNENYYINPRTCNVQASLPATQNYLADSYGLNGNIMISQSEYNQIALKSVCGWLKLQLTGNGKVVKSITLKGNNGEQVAGQLYINSADATATLASEMGGAEDNGSAGGNLVFEDAILKEVTLNCGEGVELSAEPTAFYIALPPQTFSKGISLDIVATDGSKMTKSTDKEVVIERNHILPMAEFSYKAEAPQAWKEIHYTATAKITPYRTNVFGANIVSNEWNETTGEGIITFDGEVTSIGFNAFYNRSSLTGITIPNSVTTIGGSAFKGCSNLTSVIIPDSVTTIESYAFNKCSGLTSVTIPDSVTTIEMAAFDSCSSLISITIPNSVTTIENSAFEDCSGLTSVTIGNGVTEIGGYAFYGCSNLTSITIPDSVTSIGNSAFEDCSGLTSVTIGNGVTEIGDYIFDGCLCLTSVTIGNSVTSIGGWAFHFCTSLTSITIPYSVISIGENAFYNCSGLTSVTIPDSVTSIGAMAFYNCSGLTSITIGNSVTEIGSSAFCFCTGELIINSKIVETDYTSDNFPCRNWLNNISFTKLTIGDNITKIGAYVFCSCTGLTSITIPDSVTSIGEDAFNDCRSLTSITIPDGVTSIGSSVFNGCRSLTSITIPDGVTSIGERAFFGCTSLEEVYCKPATPPTGGGSYMFNNNASGRKIYVPRNSVEAYKSAKYWSGYASYIEGYDF